MYTKKPVTPVKESSLTISVLIPAYNMGHFLGEAIQSVLAQSSPPEEILVFDNASTDGTPSIVAAFGGAVGYVRHEQNIGMYANLNAGVEACRSDYVKILCADDVMHREAIATIRQSLKSSNRPALLCTEASTEPDFLFRPLEPSPAGVIDAIMIDAILGKFPTGLPHVCFRREDFLLFGSFGRPDTVKDFSRDVVAAQRFLGCHRGCHVKVCLIYERPHPGQSRYSLNKAYQLGEFLAVIFENNLQRDGAVSRRMDEWVAHHLVASFGRIMVGQGFAYSRVVAATVIRYRAFHPRQLALFFKRIVQTLSARLLRSKGRAQDST